MPSKPLLIPEPFSGYCGNWQEWIDHFESVAVVNKWDTAGYKLKWLTVRLTGKAHTVFMKLPENTRKDYGGGVAYAGKIENPQVAFGVKQKRPQNVEEAVTVTIELESYLRRSGPITGKSHRVISVAQQQPAEDVERAEAVASVASSTENDLLGIIQTISERLYRLESSVQTRRAQATDKEPGKRSRTVICRNCGRKGHIARFRRDPPGKQQQRPHRQGPAV
eukprot:Em0022g951a